MHTALIYLLFWLVLMFLAIANGMLREATYGQYLSELRAHQLSTIAAAALFGLAVGLLAKHRLPASAIQALQIGIIWLALTVCFEFLFGHFVAGHSWSRLFQDYDLSSGRLWPLLLAWITFLPYIAYRRYNTGS